jgi:hypothetical protein
MKFSSNKTFAQKVKILAIFGLGALLVVGGAVEITQKYWKTECRLTTNDADAKEKALGIAMGLNFASQRAKPTLIDRLIRIFRPDGREGISFVGGQSEVRVFEGKEEVRVPSYEVNCMYPPFSIAEPGQTIGHPPNPLPAYCHIPPAASPSPSPGQPGCSPLPCAQATPSPTPPELDAKKFEEYLKNNESTKYGSYLQSVGALRVGADQNLTEFWATGFVIADHLFATSCHAMEPLFKKGEYGIPEPDANGNYTFNNENKLWVDFATGQLNPDKNAHNLVPATFIDCSYREGLDIALLSLNAADVPPPVTLFYDEDFANKVSIEVAALISYGDLSHPVDEITSEMYKSFIDQDTNPSQYWSYRKFVMWEGIIATAHCKDVDYLLNTASTTVGSSGSPVLAVFKPSDSQSSAHYDPLKKPLAIGVHKCCSAYFGEEDAYQELPAIPCAKLHRSPFNQDVSSKSILEEPRFCKLLSKTVEIEDYSGQKYQLECSEHAVTVKKKFR